MKIKKSIVSLLSMVVCFTLMFETVNAGIDDEVSIYPFDLGFEITAYATSVEPNDAETGLSYTLLSSSNQAYVYLHRNINQDLTSFNGIYFDIQNPSFDFVTMSLTLSPGIGSISSIAPTNDVGKITYIEEETGSFLDDDFWHKDNHGGDGHYDKEVEDDENDEDDEGELPLGVGLIENHSYFVTHSNSTYFTANTTENNMVTIPAGFNGRIYIPFFSLGLGNEANDVLLNNISSIGFSIIPKNGLSQNLNILSYGKYSYHSNHLLEQAKTGYISGADELAIPSVGINSTKQEVKGLSSDVEFRYEVVSNDSFIVITDLDEQIIGAFPRALEGYFHVRAWLNDVVCLEKTVLCTKNNSGINSVISESSINNIAYIGQFLYIKQLVEYYRYFLLIIPIVFSLIVLLVLTSNVDKKKKDDGGFE